MTRTPWIAEETRREKLVRTMVCPSCGMPAGKPCRFGGPWREIHRFWSAVSHTSRYDAAAEAGLVPPLPKVPA